MRARGRPARADRDAGASAVPPPLRKPHGDRPGRPLQRAVAGHGRRDRQRVSSGRLAPGAKAVGPQRHPRGDRRDREPARHDRSREHAVLRGTTAGPRLRAGGSECPDSSPHPDLAARQSLARLGRRREQGRRGDFQAVGAAGDASHRAAHRLGAGPGGAGCRGERVRRLAGLHASSRRGHRSAKRLRPKGRLRRANSRGAVAPLQPGGHAVNHSSSDRALQDDVIRALADAPYRASPRWRRRNLADPDRVERYARFLARHFYYERIVQFFKYSRALARITGRAPEAVCKGDAFDLLLPSVVLGSRETAQAVARLVVAHVGAARAPIAYLADLLRYEEAMMLVEAGPRIWRDDRPTEGAGGPARHGPEKVEGAWARPRRVGGPGSPRESSPRSFRATAHPEPPVTTQYESADLLLKLYDLRREAVMRKARAWFRTDFHPATAAEILTMYRGKNSAPYRMVTTYWNMAAALVLHGAIDEQMFADTNGEHVMVYGRLEPHLAELRAALKNPGYLDQLEKVILRMPDAQARLARVRGTAATAGKPRGAKSPRRVA